MKQTAIVTGASRGIGEVIALKLATLNYNISIVGRNGKGTIDHIYIRRHSGLAFD
jgi:short-subunit dehydrogenase